MSLLHMCEERNTMKCGMVNPFSVSNDKARGSRAIETKQLPRTLILRAYKMTTIIQEMRLNERERKRLYINCLSLLTTLTLTASTTQNPQDAKSSCKLSVRGLRRTCIRGSAEQRTRTPKLNISTFLIGFLTPQLTRLGRPSSTS